MGNTRSIRKDNLKILMTGGLGHLGSHLQSTLQAEDGFHQITIVDNLLTQRYCSLWHLGHNVRFVEGDFAEQQALVDSSDLVIHLAAITDAAGSFGNAKEIEEVNVRKTKVLIDQCAARGIPIIFPSSTSVYGKAKEQMFETDAGDPQSPYAQSKLDIEAYLRQSDAPWVILRLGTICGTSPGMRFHTAINKFCYQAAFGQPLTVWRQNYEQCRPYLTLVDMDQAVQMVVDGKLPMNETYNVVSENLSLHSVIETIQKMREIEITYVDTPLLNQYSYEVNFNKISSFGFKPQGSVETEILNTLQLLSSELTL